MVIDQRENKMRQSGRTTNQLKNCVKDSYFIVQNTNMIPYVKKVLKEIDREDINVESLYFINDQQYRGIKMSGLFLDHSISLNENLIMNLYKVLPALPPYYYKDYRKTKIICNKNDLYYDEKYNILNEIYQKIDFFHYIFFGGYMEEKNISFVYNTELTKIIYDFIDREMSSSYTDISEIFSKWKTIHIHLNNRGY